MKISNSHYKTLEKQIELISNQLGYHKENTNKLEKDNQYLRAKIVELSKIGGGDICLLNKLNQLPQLELEITRLQNKSKVD